MSSMNSLPAAATNNRTPTIPSAADTSLGIICQVRPAMFGRIDPSSCGGVRHTPMASGFSVVALLAAYNEADLVGDVVRDLIAQGVDVYFLDDGSTMGLLRRWDPWSAAG